MDLSKKFARESAFDGNPKWEQMIKRQKPIYSRGNDLRTEFWRDYTRILHSSAYRRLKHKTQVFYSPQNDHICTRIEHVNHVESVSYTIAQYLGLNTELTKAISCAHDLGHAPFGHEGERVLTEIAERDISNKFWHEKNGLFFVDHLELLEDDKKKLQPLNLTYAVRDGIISHCGEVDQNYLKPRNEAINLSVYSEPNQYPPFTWEACVVKLSDKISYLGRDIEDALTLRILTPENLKELSDILALNSEKLLNNTIIINMLIMDLCRSSNPDTGLTFSDKTYETLTAIKNFNYKYIYKNERIEASNRYINLILNEIYNTIKKTYAGQNTREEIIKLGKYYPSLSKNFLNWISDYWNLEKKRPETETVYKVSEDKKIYCKAILDYISGMTDKYAIETYNELISF